MSNPEEQHGPLTIEPFVGSGSEWDDAAAALKGASFCHLAGWSDVLRDTFGHESHTWVARDEAGQVYGLLPAVRVRSRLFGDYLVSMPFLSYGGPIGTDVAKALLVERATAEAKALGVDLLELRSRTPLTTELSVSHRKITVLMDLPDSAENLWNDSIRSKLRSQIRRPMKEGMEVRFGLDQLDPFYAVFSKTMRDLGTPVLPKRFFEALRNVFPTQVVFASVQHEGRPAAAGCGFLFRGEFEITWAGAEGGLSRLAPNMLLYWSLMQKSIELGATTFNFGRCTPDSGTHRFKRQWPSRDQQLHWTQWSPDDVASTPNPDSSKYRLAVATWSRLPLSLANRLGPLLSRSLP